MTDFEQNNIAEIASKFINQTNSNVFLTGKAGTGKTTFLKNITQYTYKNCIVAAPTGVAAINAGGVTLHSLFQLPFGAFIPSNTTFAAANYGVQINTPQSLLKDFQMNKTKRNMLREMELLIIDEASMLRADLLDAIDTILRFVRKQRNKVFGGVQILFIGDLFQLPPIVKNEEKEHLSPFYPSAYFFNALALQKDKLIYVELEKIYRQTDNRFIALLNNLRNNKVTDEDRVLLNKYHKPGFEATKDDGYIYLTTHNQKADEINKKALQKLKEKPYYFQAYVEGDFKDHQFPVDYKLELKKGSQVMFIKNDYSGEQRYFNGKIGTISQLANDEIIVAFKDGSAPAEVERYTWENKKYSLNKENNEIVENVVGTLSHYPIKLAWAITVHKSQGLTFEKAIIDVSRAFAPGQIYVALSRLTSLKGLVLTAPINTDSLFKDKSLTDFAAEQKKIDQLDDTLSEETRKFLADSALMAFNFNWLSNTFAYHAKSYDKDEKKSKKQVFKTWAVDIENSFKPIKETADKFVMQIRSITQSQEEDYILLLQERIFAAQKYFEPLLKKLSGNIIEHIETLNKIKKIKTYINELKELELQVFSQQQKISKCVFLLNAVIEDTELSKKSLHSTQLYKDREKSIPKEDKKKTKPLKKEPGEKKINTKQHSYNLYLEGKNIDEIAKERSILPRTIEGHLAYFISEGKLDVKKFVTEEKIDEIIHAAKKLDTTFLTPIKEKLGDDFSFVEIKFALASMKGNE